MSTPGFTPLEDLPPERKKLTVMLLQAGYKRWEIEEMLGAFVHELAEQQRAHIVYRNDQLSWHRHTLYGMAGETFEAQQELDALEQGIVKELTALIDPKGSAGPVRPGEEPTA